MPCQGSFRGVKVNGKTVKKLLRYDIKDTNIQSHVPSRTDKGLYIGDICIVECNPEDVVTIGSAFGRKSDPDSILTNKILLGTNLLL